MKKLTVAIFDSGVGGLSIYQELRTSVPKVNYLYASDSLNFPYGDKTREQVVDCVLGFLKQLVHRYPIDILIIACNTASTHALDAVRQQFPRLQVIGVVPAIKPAAAQSITKKIGLLATPGTVANPYTKNLIRDFCQGVEVVSVGSRDLVTFAESKARGERVDIDHIRNVLAPFFSDDKQIGIDQIVLGCTHFPWLKEELELASKWPVTWVDSSAAIGRRLQEVIGKDFELENHLPREVQIAVFSKVDGWVRQLSKVVLSRGFEIEEI